MFQSIFFNHDKLFFFVKPVLSRVKCLAPGHDAIPPKMLKSLTYWSQMEYCTTEIMLSTY